MTLTSVEIRFYANEHHADLGADDVTTIYDPRGDSERS